jgi:cell wall-associated NlpC family hydrolase
VGFRLALAVAVAAALPAAATATPSRSPDWAAPQIRALASHGLLMGAAGVSTFSPSGTLTRGALASLLDGLQLELTPPDPSLAGTNDGGDPGTTTTDPGSTTTTDTTTTTPAPAPAPTAVKQPNATVTMAGLDSQLVAMLGLSGAASEFARDARAAGLAVPPRFGAEVVARLLGLRTNHPAAQDYLELRPQDPATRAEAAYSAAQILTFGSLDSSWQVAAVQQLADTFSLPQLTDWQRQILDVAVSKIGMPYVWGGTSDVAETEFGVTSRGGYDCSGFVWRVYKLQSYPDEGTLATTLLGRTTFTMSVEVPKTERIPFAQLQPADVIFFGTKGQRSKGSQVIHTGIYLGNGWFIHSSDYGVALAQLSGWYRQEFAWGRRPLAEAGLESS